MAARSLIVLDAGAIVALINLEPGAATVRQLLRTHKGACVIHAVNLLEVFYGFQRPKGTAFAKRVLDLVEKSGVEVRGDFDRAFLMDAGLLKTTHKMSLADTFGVALARRLGAPFVSTDHHELDAVDAVGVCQVLFIR
jgi:PIN domain nuclease of toxin-antitoxin system